MKLGIFEDGGEEEVFEGEGEGEGVLLFGVDVFFGVFARGVVIFDNGAGIFGCAGVLGRGAGGFVGTLLEGEIGVGTG